MNERLYPALPDDNKKSDSAQDGIHSTQQHQVRRQGIAGLLPALGGSSALPLLLIVGALQQQRNRQGPTAARGIKPADAIMPPLPEATAIAEDPQEHLPPTPPAARPYTPPVDVRNLLHDISAYLPGDSGASASRAARLMSLADEIREMGHRDETVVASAFTNPIDRHVGLLNALSRNIPNAGNLGQVGQVLGMVNSLKSSGNMLNALSGLGGMGNALGAMNMNTPARAQPTELKRVPSQTDGLKDTVTRLLSGMDEKQKSDLMNQAKNFLGK